jgi:hypothetical protein
LSKDFEGLAVSIDIDDVHHDLSLEEDITIDGNNLNQEFIDHSRKYARWAMLSELAQDKVQVLKNKLAALYASVDHRVRTDAVIAQVKLTEKMVENTVILDAVYQAGMKEYLQACKEYGLLKCGKEAFQHRKDMLVSLGDNHRAQGQQDPSIGIENIKESAQLKVNARKAMKKSDQ